MAWSLMNHLRADQVAALLDTEKDAYGPDVARFYSREQAEAIVHAALWGYGVREDSTAGVYAAMNLFKALGLKFWTFDEGEAAELHALRMERMKTRASAEGLPQPKTTPVDDAGSAPSDKNTEASIPSDEAIEERA